MPDINLLFYYVAANNQLIFHVAASHLSLRLNMGVHRSNFNACLPELLGKKTLETQTKNINNSKQVCTRQIIATQVPLQFYLRVELSPLATSSSYVFKISADQMLNDTPIRKYRTHLVRAFLRLDLFILINYSYPFTNAFKSTVSSYRLKSTINNWVPVDAFQLKQTCLILSLPRHEK